MRSILRQTCGDYEILIKDGGSTDGSVERCPEDARIHLIRGKDQGIYDAMNIAVRQAQGLFFYFLNTGDYLKTERVLEDVQREICRAGGAAADDDIPLNGSTERDRTDGHGSTERDRTDGHGSTEQSRTFGKTGRTPDITKENTQYDLQAPQKFVLYGDVFERRSGQVAAAKPVMDDFALFRNVPCHQACFYSRDLFSRRGFDTDLRVRADYEHFLYCHYRAGARMVYFPETIADYEGGGFSETAENRRISAKEHRLVTQLYMPAGKVLLYRAWLAASLQPLREKLARNPKTAGLYDHLKSRIYHRGSEK